jgi:hypothetical protein
MPTAETATAIIVCFVGVVGTSKIASAYCAKTKEFVAVNLISVEVIPWTHSNMQIVARTTEGLKIQQT